MESRKIIRIIVVSVYSVGLQSTERVCPNLQYDCDFAEPLLITQLYALFYIDLHPVLGCKSIFGGGYVLDLNVDKVAEYGIITDKHMFVHSKNATASPDKMGLSGCRVVKCRKR